MFFSKKNKPAPRYLKLRGSSAEGNNWPLTSSGNFLFLAGAVSVMTGAAISGSGLMFDLTIGISISLTCAILLINFLTSSALQLQGFSALALTAVSFRIAAVTATVRLTAAGSESGIFAGLFDPVSQQLNIIIILLLSIPAAGIIFNIIYKSAGFISSTSTEYTDNIAPIKQIAIRGNLHTRVVNRQEAEKNHNDITTQAFFFAGMNGLSRYILAAAVLELLVIITNILTVMVLAVSDSHIAANINYILCFCIIIQTCSVSTALAAGKITRKSFQHASEDYISEQELSEQMNQQHEKREDNIKDLEWEEMTTNSLPPSESGYRIWKDRKDISLYNHIADSLENAAKTGTETPTTIMAAEKTEQLGVTTPVNTAMRLAKRGIETVLIDLDLKRQSVAKVFDTAATKNKVTESCIKNLSIYSCTDLPGLINLKDEIQDLKKKYQCIILYAPDIDTSEIDWDIIMEIINSALLFGEENQGTLEDFARLTAGLRHRIISPDE
mgnify:CR=1 FL=1